MLLKKLFLITLLLLIALVMIPGCATTGKSKDDDARQYRIARDECVRFGYRSDTPEFKSCIEKRLES